MTVVQIPLSTTILLLALTLTHVAPQACCFQLGAAHCAPQASCDRALTMWYNPELQAVAPFTVQRSTLGPKRARQVAK